MPSNTPIKHKSKLDQPQLCSLMRDTAKNWWVYVETCYKAAIIFSTCYSQRFRSYGPLTKRAQILFRRQSCSKYIGIFTTLSRGPCTPHRVETYWRVCPTNPTPHPNIKVGQLGGRVALPATYPTLTLGVGGRWHGQKPCQIF